MNCKKRLISKVAVMDFLNELYKYATSVRNHTHTHTYTSPQCQWCDFVKWPRPLHGHSQGPLPSAQPHKSSSIYPSQSNLPSSILPQLRAPPLCPAMWRNLRVTSIDLWPAVTSGGSSCGTGVTDIDESDTFNSLRSATVWTVINKEELLIKRVVRNGI